MVITSPAPSGRNLFLSGHRQIEFWLINHKKNMSNTYSQISIQIVFAVKYREALILPSFRNELFRYIHGIIEHKKQLAMAVNGTVDHVHIFAGISPAIYIPDLVRDIKSDSSLFVNNNFRLPKRFRWQEGYGVFSYGMSQRGDVISYIMNQEEHHKKRSFNDEYTALLEKFGVNYNPRYLFHEPH